MKKIMIMSSFLFSSLFLSTFAPAQSIFIPPQYQCEAIDDSGNIYRDVSGGKVDVKTFGYANDKMIAEAAESAMAECLNISSQPRTCDLISCVENPQ